MKCAATSMSSKLISQSSNFFTKMVVDAVMHLEDDLPLDMIGIKKVPVCIASLPLGGYLVVWRSSTLAMVECLPPPCFPSVVFARFQQPLAFPCLGASTLYLHTLKRRLFDMAGCSLAPGCDRSVATLPFSPKRCTHYMEAAWFCTSPSVTYISLQLLINIIYSPPTQDC